MKISEIFYSIQGEGILAGVPSIFIRLSGCNLRCIYCDTRRSSWEANGEELSVDKILEKAFELSNAKNVVITGGEPILSDEIKELTLKLKSQNKHITIETNGTLFKDDVYADLISISPKLSYSIPLGTSFELEHKKKRLNFFAMRSFINKFDYQLKFVVSKIEDIEEIKMIINEIGKDVVKPEKILLMPLGTNKIELETRSEWLVKECLKYNYRFAPRLHIYLFGNVPGK